MRILYETKLFVDTLQNTKYLHEDSIQLGIVKKSIFYGIGSKIRAPRNNFVVKWVLVILFPFVLILNVNLELFKLSIRILKSKKAHLTCDKYFIATTNFSKSINNRINQQIDNSCWILNYNVAPRNYDIKNDNFVFYFQLIDIWDALVSTIGTLIAYTMICRTYGVYYMLESINAFYWLVYNRACKKIPRHSSIFFIEHKDRWAFLAEHIYCHKKTLIQHGTEISNCSALIASKRNLIKILGGYTQNLPNKFTSLTQVIALSEAEIPALKCSILDCEPQFVIGGYGFETYALESNKLSVLIIAHSGIYLYKEIEIIKSLQDLKIDIYIKNHPTQNNDCYESLLKLYNFNLIYEQKFPHVNIVVAYDSTLAHEYKSAGIDVIYHTKHSIDEIRSTIISKI